MASSEQLVLVELPVLMPCQGPAYRTDCAPKDLPVTTQHAAGITARPTLGPAHMRRYRQNDRTGGGQIRERNIAYSHDIVPVLS